MDSNGMYTECNDVVVSNNIIGTLAKIPGLRM